MNPLEFNYYANEDYRKKLENKLTESFSCVLAEFITKYLEKKYDNISDDDKYMLVSAACSMIESYEIDMDKYYSDNTISTTTLDSIKIIDVTMTHMSNMGFPFGNIGGGLNRIGISTSSYYRFTIHNEYEILLVINDCVKVKIKITGTGDLYSFIHYIEIKFPGSYCVDNRNIKNEILHGYLNNENEWLNIKIDEWHDNKLILGYIFQLLNEDDLISELSDEIPDIKIKVIHYLNELQNDDDDSEEDIKL